jgi:hypothetical protein
MFDDFGQVLPRFQPRELELRPLAQPLRRRRAQGLGGRRQRDVRLGVRDVLGAGNRLVPQDGAAPERNWYRTPARACPVLSRLDTAGSGTMSILRSSLMTPLPRRWMLFFLAASLAAQFRPPAPSPYREADRKIFAEIDQNNELMANLEYLCDMIGPRLTGSDKMKMANQWTKKRFEDYGLEKARLESWTIANGWTRGTASGRIVEPATHRLTVASAGWAPSTSGALRGRLVYAKADTPAELEKLKGQLKGAIVIATEPARMPAPAGERPPSALDALAGERGRDEPNVPMLDRMRIRRQVNDLMKKEGVAAVLRESSKEHGLLNMGGIGGANYQVESVPTAFIVHEDYVRLWRLLQRQQPVDVEVEIRNEITKGPIEVYNTVAEIPGGEKADELVFVGAHLDSWDLGDGATDNATGSAVVLEAARAIRASGLKPKRTIRFLLFSGEEQGMVGSREYIKAHKEELDRIQAVVIHDTGTGRVKSFAVNGRYDVREALDKIAEPLREIGLSAWKNSACGVPAAATTNRSPRPACPRCSAFRTRLSTARPTTRNRTRSTRCARTRSSRAPKPWPRWPGTCRSIPRSWREASHNKGRRSRRRARGRVSSVSGPNSRGTPAGGAGPRDPGRG